MYLYIRMVAATAPPPAPAAPKPDDAFATALEQAEQEHLAKRRSQEAAAAAAAERREFEEELQELMAAARRDAAAANPRPRPGATSSSSLDALGATGIVAPRRPSPFESVLLAQLDSLLERSAAPSPAAPADHQPDFGDWAPSPLGSSADGLPVRPGTVSARQWVVRSFDQLPLLGGKPRPRKAAAARRARLPPDAPPAVAAAAAAFSCGADPWGGTGSAASPLRPPGRQGQQSNVTPAHPAAAATAPRLATAAAARATPDRSSQRFAARPHSAAAPRTVPAAAARPFGSVADLGLGVTVQHLGRHAFSGAKPTPQRRPTSASSALSAGRAALLPRTPLPTVDLDELALAAPAAAEPAATPTADEAAAAAAVAPADRRASSPVEPQPSRSRPVSPLAAAVADERPGHAAARRAGEFAVTRRRPPPPRVIPDGGGSGATTPGGASPSFLSPPSSERASPPPASRWRTAAAATRKGALTGGAAGAAGVGDFERLTRRAVKTHKVVDALRATPQFRELNEDSLTMLAASGQRRAPRHVSQKGGGRAAALPPPGVETPRNFGGAHRVEACALLASLRCCRATPCCTARRRPRAASTSCCKGRCCRARRAAHPSRP